MLVSTAVSGVFREDQALPVTGPDQLISQLHEPHIGGYSGTITAQVELGLPDAVSAAITAVAPAGTLLRGSHRLRFWYGDPTRQRVAVINQTSEQDLFRNGNEVWQWDTSTRVATRSSVAKATDAALPLQLSSPAALTPAELTSQLLDLVGGSSDTTLRSGDPIADRPTYELALHPPDSSRSRIAEIDIEVDGRQGVPLAVQIYSVGAAEPVLDVSFDDVSFSTPSQQNFDFVPPDDAQVEIVTTTNAVVPLPLDRTSVIGSGWDAVASYRSSTMKGRALAQMAGDLLGPRARAVKGTWGKGRLLQSSALTVLVTSKGRVVVGAVSPEVLYAAVR